MDLEGLRRGASFLPGPYPFTHPREGRMEWGGFHNLEVGARYKRCHFNVLLDIGIIVIF